MNRKIRLLFILVAVVCIVLLPVFLKAIGYGFNSVGANIGIVFNMLVVLYIYLYGCTFRYLKLNGVRTKGIVINIEHTGNSVGRGSNRILLDNVELEYYVYNYYENINSSSNIRGKVSAKLLMRRDRIDYPIIGSEVSIVYDPKVPKKIFLEEMVERQNKYRIIMIPILFLIMTIGLAIITKK